MIYFVADKSQRFSRDQIEEFLCTWFFHDFLKRPGMHIDIRCIKGENYTALLTKKPYASFLFVNQEIFKCPKWYQIYHKWDWETSLAIFLGHTG